MKKIKKEKAFFFFLILLVVFLVLFISQRNDVKKFNMDNDSDTKDNYSNYSFYGNNSNSSSYENDSNHSSYENSTNYSYSENNSGYSVHENNSNYSSYENESKYPLHEDITVTIFWVGEGANKENEFISNAQSAWDERWKEHYGGTDNPSDRNGYLPADFTPNENSFYFALPYNDFDDERKSNSENIYWANEKNWGDLDSMCKNRWIKIIKGNNTVYAQWEDVGPFEEDDFNYVFGDDLPKNKINNNAGLDVSPAIRDYLDLQDIDVISWQFVDFSEVPEGPWKTTITTSQITWE